MTPASQWAAHYASLGMHPLRLQPPVAGDASTGKRPIANAWQEAPPDAAEAWRPGENLGLRMGLQPDGRTLIALDEDSAGVVAALEARLGPLPSTFTTMTGKGRHLLFEVPSEAVGVLTNRTRLGGVPLDLRGQGGQVVAAPSAHYSGVIYALQSNAPPAHLPQEWLGWLVNECAAHRAPSAPAQNAPDRDDRWLTYARAWLAGIKPAVEGDGGGALFGAACGLARGWLLPDATVDLLLQVHYNPRCEPPWNFANREHLNNWQHSLRGASNPATESRFSWGGLTPDRVENGERSLNKATHPDQPHVLNTPVTAIAGVQVAQVPPGVSTPAAAAPASAPPNIPDIARQGQQATRETWVGLMNTQHIVLDRVGGKVRVVTWAESDLGWQVPVLQSFPAFRDAYLSVRVNVENAEKPQQLADLWLTHPHHLHAHNFCFRPDVQQPIVNGDLNLWKGYGIPAAKSNWRLMFEFIRDDICDGDAEAFTYVMSWCAWVIQNPGVPAEVALVLKGQKGTGKNTLFDALCEMLGSHAKTVTSPKHLTGNFNGHLRDCALLFANEAIPPNDKAAEAVLKGLITDHNISIERKGLDVENCRNALSICLATNEDWAIPAGLDERRFAVFYVSSAHAGKAHRQYWVALRAELRTGGLGGMLHDLLALQLNGWHPRDSVPDNAPLLDQKLRTLRGADSHVYQMLDTGHTYTPLSPAQDGSAFVCTAFLIEAFKLDHRRYRELSLAVAKCCPEDTVSTKEQVLVKRVRGRWLPALPQARELWAAATGLVGIEWSDVDEWSDDS